MLVRSFPLSFVGPGDLRAEIARVLGRNDIEIWGAYTGGEVDDYGLRYYQVVVEAHPGCGGFENKREVRLCYSRRNSSRQTWRIPCCALRIDEELGSCLEWIETKRVQVGEPSVGARAKALLSEAKQVVKRSDLEDNEYSDSVDDDWLYPPWNHGVV